MPYYEIIFENVSSIQHPPGWKQVEHCSAPSVEVVDQMVRKDCSRYVNVEQYKWTITEVPPPKTT
jgi:hypothetical protein